MNNSTAAAAVGELENRPFLGTRKYVLELAKAQRKVVLLTRRFSVLGTGLPAHALSFSPNPVHEPLVPFLLTKGECCSLLGKTKHEVTELVALGVGRRDCERNQKN